MSGAPLLALAWRESRTARRRLLLYMSSISFGVAAIVDRGLLVTLNASVGDSISLGSTRLEVIGLLESVPGDLGITATIGPRIYMSQSNLAATGLLGFGSRASYEAVVKLPSYISPE